MRPIRRISGSIPFLSGTVVALLGLGTSAPTPSKGCPVFEPTERISIDLGRGQAALLEIYAEKIEIGDAADREVESMSREMISGEIRQTNILPSRRCTAWIQIPLSIFPSSRLATRPADIARSMRDVMKKLAVQECRVGVAYLNDTNDAIPEHELCFVETFAFGERKHWSTSSESPCWQPEDFEIVTTE